MVLVGNVKDKVAIIVDDMADTCGTLAKAADTVMQHGALEVNAIVVHGILSGKAIENLNGSCLKRYVHTSSHQGVYIANFYSQHHCEQHCSPG